MSNDPQNLDRLELLRAHFQNGRFGEILPLLELLKKVKLTPAQRLLCASVARQGGNPSAALEFLRRSVYPTPLKKSRTSETPDPLEIAEYAASTAMLGGHRESQRLFTSIRENPPAEILFLEAQGYLAVFDYERAIPLLRRFLESDLTPQNRRAGELRLLLSCMRAPVPEPETAQRVLEAFLDPKRADLSTPERMYAGQMSVEYSYFFEKNPKKALQRARALTERYPQHNSTGLLLWDALLATVYGKDTAANSERMEKDRQRVIAEGNGYSLRQFDLYRATVLRDSASLHRFIQGTPYPGMRGLARRWYFSPVVTLPDSSLWVPNVPWTSSNSAQARWPRFLVAEGRLEGQRKTLRDQELLFKLMQALCADFYAEKTEHELNEVLYPELPHRGLESTQKIYALFHRLRKWLEQAKIPITIEANGRSYRISPTSQVLFVCSLREEDEVRGGIESDAERDLEELYTTLLNHFGPEQEFASSAVAQLLEISPRGAVYKIQGLLKAGYLHASGKGPARRYRLCSWQGGSPSNPTQRARDE